MATRSSSRKKGKPPMEDRRASLLEPGPLPPIMEVGDEFSVNTSLDSKDSTASELSMNSVTSRKRKKKGGLYSAFTAPKLKNKKKGRKQ